MKRSEAHLPEKTKNELDKPDLSAVDFVKYRPELRPEFFNFPRTSLRSGVER